MTKFKDYTTNSLSTTFNDYKKLQFHWKKRKLNPSDTLFKFKLKSLTQQSSCQCSFEQISACPSLELLSLRPLFSRRHAACTCTLSGQHHYFFQTQPGSERVKWNQCARTHSQKSQDDLLCDAVKQWLTFRFIIKNMHGEGTGLRALFKINQALIDKPCVKIHQNIIKTFILGGFLWCSLSVTQHHLWIKVIAQPAAWIQSFCTSSVFSYLKNHLFIMWLSCYSKLCVNHSERAPCTETTSPKVKAATVQLGQCLTMFPKWCDRHRVKNPNLLWVYGQTSAIDLNWIKSVWCVVQTSPAWQCTLLGW